MAMQCLTSWMDDLVVLFVCVNEKKMLVIIIKNQQQYTSTKYGAYLICHIVDENEHEHTTFIQCAMAMTTDLLWLHEYVQCSVLRCIRVLKYSQQNQ